jgi:NADH-quinone oxidoreductase subunit H
MSELLITLSLLLVKLGLIFAVVLSLAAYMVLAERKILGRMQLRHGPNRVGPCGMLQPLADVIKLLTKEDLVPAKADRIMFLIAPGMASLIALLSFAVVPFSPPVTLFGRTIPMVVCDLTSACSTSSASPRWRSTASPWGAGPRTRSTPCSARSAAWRS